MCHWKSEYHKITSIGTWSAHLISPVYGNTSTPPLKAQCTTSKQGRTLCRSVHEDYLDRVRAFHTTEAHKKAYRTRSVWVEPLCAEGKDWHGMRRLRLRCRDA